MNKKISDLIIEMFFTAFPIVVLSSVVTGFMGTMEMIYHIRDIIKDIALVPGVTGEFIFREVGVVVPSLLFVAQIGASFTAELASMKNTEQLDALKILKISTTKYYLFPRIIAVCVSNFLLCIIAVVVVITSAAMYAVVFEGFTWGDYMERLRTNVTPIILLMSFVKALIFGIICPLICAWIGILAHPTSRGVGIATTQSVVICTLLIIFADLVINSFFSFM